MKNVRQIEQKTHNNKKYATEEHITLVVILFKFYLFLNSFFVGHSFMAIVWLLLMILSILEYKKNYYIEENDEEDKE